MERLKTIEKNTTMSCYLTVITDKRKNHCMKLSLILVITNLLILFPGISTKELQAQSSSEKKFTVTIDAGHGGKDSGAPGKKSLEKNLALGIALKVGHYIESLMDDVSVHYTRKTDVFIPLYERAQISNRNKSDLFISIHVNANKKTAPTGTSTYVMGYSKSAENLDLVMQENKSIYLEQDYQANYGNFDPTSPESYILFNNVQNSNLTESLELASAVQSQLRTRAQRKDMGVHQGNLVVLWACTTPSILIETGFISNAQEEEFLMTDNGQDIIASAIYMAFREYKETVDSRVNNGLKPSNQVARTEKKVVGSENKVSVAEKSAQEAVKPITTKENKVTENVNKDYEPAKEVVKELETQTIAASPSVSKPIVSGSNSSVEYRVQVLASQKRLSLNASDFKGVKDLQELQFDGYYKYFSKAVDTYQQALEIKQELGVSFKGAFIVAFKDGVKVPFPSVDQRK
jgi:N-acetylmuramoyl-L-alanine amidase